MVGHRGWVLRAADSILRGLVLLSFEMLDDHVDGSNEKNQRDWVGQHYAFFASSSSHLVFGQLSSRFGKPSEEPKKGRIKYEDSNQTGRV